MQILMVDDSKAVHAFVTDCLSKMNAKIEHSFNGKEGLEKLHSGKFKFDLVLLDWEMPVLNGPETLPQIRKDFPDLPVVMLTSKNDPQDMIKMLEMGAAEYVLKPFTADILVGKLETIVTEKVA